MCRVADGGCDRRGGDRADAAHSCEPLAHLIGTMPRQEIALELGEPAFGRAQLLDQ